MLVLVFNTVSVQNQTFSLIKLIILSYVITKVLLRLKIDVVLKLFFIMKYSVKLLKFKLRIKLAWV